MSVVGTSPPPLHIKRAIRDSYHPATKGVVWDDVNVTVGNSVWGNVEDAVNGAAIGVGRAVNGAYPTRKYLATFKLGPCLKFYSGPLQSTTFSP